MNCFIPLHFNICFEILNKFYGTVTETVTRKHNNMILSNTGVDEVSYFVEQLLLCSPLTKFSVRKVSHKNQGFFLIFVALPCLRILQNLTKTLLLNTVIFYLNIKWK